MQTARDATLIFLLLVGVLSVRISTTDASPAEPSAESTALRSFTEEPFIGESAPERAATANFLPEETFSENGESIQTASLLGTSFFGELARQETKAALAKEPVLAKEQKGQPARVAEPGLAEWITSNARSLPMIKSESESKKVRESKVRVYDLHQLQAVQLDTMKELDSFDFSHVAPTSQPKGAQPQIAQMNIEAHIELAGETGRYEMIVTDEMMDFPRKLRWIKLGHGLKSALTEAGVNLTIKKEEQGGCKARVAISPQA